MKLCCFVILVFISVIFTVMEAVWGIGGVNSLPIPSTNNKAIQPTIESEPVPKTSPLDYPSPNPNNPNNQNNQINNGGNGKQHRDDEDDKKTAKKLEEETQIINRVIVVLASLGASLLLVAIAIAVLYWKVRKVNNRSRMINDGRSGVNTDVNTEDVNANSDINNNNNDKNENGNEKAKGDNGGCVEPGTNISDGENFEKSNVVEVPNSSDGNNGVVKVVGNSDKVNNEVSEYYHPVQIHSVPQLSPPAQPSAPPAEKIIEETEETDINSSNLLISAPSLTAPPAYSPTAPPIYALQHSPIPEFDDSTREIRDTIQYTNGNNTYNNNGGTIIRMPSHLPPPVASPSLNTGVWYVAGPTSQTTHDYQQFNSIIIQSINPSSTSTTNLNSSSNLHENNNDDNKPTHQRHNSSTI